MSIFIKDPYSRHIALFSDDHKTLAAILATETEPDEIRLISSDADDISSSLFYTKSHTKISSGGFEASEGCDLFIIDSHDARSVAKNAVDNGFDGVFLVIGSADECDAVLKGSGYYHSRKSECLATDVMPKNASLRMAIGKYFSVSPHDVSVFFIGCRKNGFIAWSSGSVCSKSIPDIIEDSYGEYSYERLLEISSEAILKPDSYLSHAFAASALARAILYDERRVLTVCSMLSGDYGHSGVCASLPAIVGKRGISEKLKLPFDSFELSQLQEICNDLSAGKKEASAKK